MDFNKKIYELNKQKLNYINLDNEIQREKEIELEKFEKELDLKYQDRIKFNQEKIDEILSEELKFYKMIEYYSLFNEDDIVKILIDLINVFENKEFVYKIVPIYKDSSFKISKPVRILINKKYVQKYFLSETITNLVNKGATFILDEYQNINGIFFYEYNLEKNSLIPKINLKNFPYLKEFIDYAISYKIDNKISKISFDMLNMLKFKFISSKTSELKSNYEINKAMEKYSESKNKKIR